MSFAQTNTKTTCLPAMYRGTFRENQTRNISTNTLYQPLRTLVVWAFADTGSENLKGTDLSELLFIPKY